MSIDLSTRYLGLRIRNPLVAAASTRTGSIEGAVQLAKAGIGALVMRSIFEEQIRADVDSMYDDLSYDPHPEALEYLRADLPMELGPAAYLDSLQSIREHVDVPVIASINCTHPDTWVGFARKLEAAGAAAIELNIYDIPDHPAMVGSAIEARHVDLVRQVTAQVKIPVAVKLSPYYSALLQMGVRLDQAGAGGLVLFNRFFQPDIDIRLITLKNVLNLSRPEDIRLPLRWIALLRDHVRGSLSLTGGVHDAEGLTKALLAGADTAQLCSVLYRSEDPVGTIRDMLQGLTNWMRQHQFETLEAFRGRLRETDLSAHAGFERFQYVRTLAEQ